MPRDIPVGNGRLLVNFDDRYRLRDLYYPHVGSENHSAGYPFRFGVWCDGRFSWTDSDEWKRSLDYLEDTLVTDVLLDWAGAGLSLRCHDAVHFDETIYLRSIRVTNHMQHSREVRLFFHQDFRIKEFDTRDTAYYHPDLNAIIHYKENRYFLVNGIAPDGCGICEFTTGIKCLYGWEGTWRDAEDGKLERNPIAQGCVDSCISLRMRVEPGQTVECWYWICANDHYEGAKTLNRCVTDLHPRTLLDLTTVFWRLWVNKRADEFGGLPEEIVRLYKRSLLAIRTQIDANGAIVAATDSDIMQFSRDTYCYVWPRDGALVADALDRAGYDDLASRFFTWCRTVLTRYGYFLHKYNADGSAGSSWHPWIVNGEPQLPVQEDETALVLWAIFRHFERHRDPELLKSVYHELLVCAGEWMMKYVDARTGLPLPSYDLWEERRGVTAWTVGAVHGALSAIERFNERVGHDDEARRFRDAAERMKRGAATFLWQPELNRFARMVTFDADGTPHTDATVDASIAGLFLFGMFDPEDPQIEATMRCIRERLTVKTNVGGIARYENDYYHQVSSDVERVPGNPWFISTLWQADYLIATARSIPELEEAHSMLVWCAHHAQKSGILAEQLDPYSGAPLSVAPLTWSHAAFISTVRNYVERRNELASPRAAEMLLAQELDYQETM
jgi:GH15 family glucan-1,4-alpha-glucosidase